MLIRRGGVRDEECLTQRRGRKDAKEEGRRATLISADLH